MFDLYCCFPHASVTLLCLVSMLLFLHLCYIFSRGQVQDIFFRHDERNAEVFYYVFFMYASVVFRRRKRLYITSFLFMSFLFVLLVLRS
jgi:hypothetical protein